MAQRVTLCDLDGRHLTEFLGGVCLTVGFQRKLLARGYSQRTQSDYLK